jgi:hypothetical protein
MFIPIWILRSQRTCAVKALVVAAGIFCLSAGAQAQTAVVMSQYEPGRTAANLDEHLLGPSNVGPATFGKLFARSVDDSVYALPLIVPNLPMPGFGSRNVMFVATMGNTVYAFDADDPAASQPFWSTNLGAPAPGDSWIGPIHHGILSTPFVDLGTGTLYVVAKIRNASDDIEYWIFALDVLTGGSKYNSPRRVDFPFAGGPTLTNVPDGIQRVGLLVSDGTLYVAFASIVPGGDPHSYWSQEGFLQTFDASDLQTRLAIFQTTPTGLKGGLWQAGRGVAADTDGNIYVASAAGTYDGAANFGSSAMKFTPRSLQLLDWFTPSNWQYLLDNNIDLSANGVTMIPNTNLLFAGGKSGIVYLLDRSNLGKLEGSQAGPVQSFQASAGCGLTDCAQTLGTAFWAHSAGGTLYVWDRGDFLRAYPFTNGRFVTLPSSQSAVRPAMTGGPSVSAEGDDIATGIVWAASMNVDDSEAQAPGTLHAFLASDVSQELYNSNAYGSRDAWGNFTKFAAPVVANGKVYVPTQTNAVAVFGPLCGVDVTSRLTVSRGPLRHVGRNRYAQEITATNIASHALGAPFDVALDVLRAGTTVTNATGSTSCARPASPYLRRNAPLWLQPGQSFTFTVQFSSRRINIRYRTRVLTGGGAR